MKTTQEIYEAAVNIVKDAMLSEHQRMNCVINYLFC